MNIYTGPVTCGYCKSTCVDSQAALRCFDSHLQRGRERAATDVDVLAHRIRTHLQYKFGRKLFALTAVAATLTLQACTTLAPSSYRVEVEHISHPLAGWPVSANNTEDGLSQANVIARWTHGRVYVENGLGYNLQGRNGGGFYGPALTYTGRIGVEFGKR